MLPVKRIVNNFVIITALIISSSVVNEISYGRQLQATGGSSERVINGLVKDEKGQPVKDASIVTTVPLISSQTVRNEILTNTEGKFSFRIIPMSGFVSTSTGTITSSPFQETQNIFVRQRERNLAAELKLDDKKDNYEVTLSPGFILSGKVVDFNVDGIRKAEISLGFHISERVIASFPEPMKIDQNGNFEIRALLKDSKYLVFANCDGYEQRSVEVNTNEAVNERMNIEPFVLDLANLSVSGVVVDQSGQPVSNAQISVHGGNLSFMQQIYFTNSKGEFNLEKISAGAIVIQAQKDGPQSMVGQTRANGGDKDIKIVVSSINLGRSVVPKQPPSLINKPLPDVKNIGIDLSAAQFKDKQILICFWDMEQRPSRNCILELSKKVQELKAESVEVILIHASKTEKEYLDKWFKEYNVDFPVGMIEKDEEQIKFNWGIKALPWLILTNKEHIVKSEGFSVNELDEKL